MLPDAGAVSKVSGSAAPDGGCLTTGKSQKTQSRNRSISYVHVFASIFNFLIFPSFPFVTQACVRVLQPGPAAQLHRRREHAHQHQRRHAHHGAAAQQRRPAGPGETSPLAEAPQLHEQDSPAHAAGPSRGIRSVWFSAFSFDSITAYLPDSSFYISAELCRLRVNPSSLSSVTQLICPHSAR